MTGTAYPSGAFAHRAHQMWAPIGASLQCCGCGAGGWRVGDQRRRAPRPAPRVIAVDGKSARGARRADERAVHLLAAFEVGSGIVLGQSAVDGKSNEITAFDAVQDVSRTNCPKCSGTSHDTIIGKLAAMVERFTTTSDCVDHSFIGDDLLDRLPAPARIGATRVGGVDLNKPRIRAALFAVLALSAAAGGFTVAESTARVHAMSGTTGYTIRQAANDLRKLRGT